MRIPSSCGGLGGVGLGAGDIRRTGSCLGSGAGAGGATSCRWGAGQGAGGLFGAGVGTGASAILVGETAGLGSAAGS
jgi:hypothetical protein